MDDIVRGIKLGRLTVQKDQSTGGTRRAIMGAFVKTHPCVVILLFFSLPVFSKPFLSCNLHKKFHLNGMHKEGDVVLGGLFEVHYSSVFPELSFTSEPNQPRCQG